MLDGQAAQMQGQYAPAPRQEGIFFVPQEKGPPAAAPGPGLMTVTVTGEDIDKARVAAMAKASASAAAKGWGGRPGIRSESFNAGNYMALVEFPIGAGSAEPVDADQPAPVPGGGGGQAAARPSWMIVVPVEITADGKPHWGHDSEWCRSWIAPQRRAGIRLVPTLGDADDHDRLPVALLADPDDSRTAAAAGSLARKYGAPGVAIVLLDMRDSTVGVWMWQGGGARRADGAAGASTAASRDNGLALLTGLLDPRAAQHGDFDARPTHADDADAAAEPVPPGQSRPVARGQPVDLEVSGAAGAMGFSIWLDSSDQARQTEVRRAVRNIIGISMRRVHQDGDGLEITGDWTGPDGQAGLARALAQAGVAVR